jgi:putative redox protein
MKANIVWQGKMKFVGTAPSGHPVEMDAPPAVGGEDSASRPKELLLDSLAGCTAMDVISILRKMQVEPEAFRVEVIGELTDEHPIVFTHFHIKYIVKGDVPEAKLKKAIQLSQERYCGVSAMFRRFAQVDYEYVFE